MEGDGVAPDRIFVGTFTRAIARELRDELGEDIKVLTLHSLAYELLRQNPAACQGMKLRFLLAYEEDAMLYDIADRVPAIDDQHKRRRELRRMQSARAERQEYGDAAFAGAVHGWLQRDGGMLIGEVVYLAVLGLESHDIPPGQYDHVVIDEYQDLTAAEQELVELVWSQRGSLVVMGDNDQSIYSFRFNHPSGIDEFTERWTGQGGVDLSFTENRRCGEAILHVANLMMAEAGSTRDPMLGASGLHGEVALVHWRNVDEEIAGLARFIASKPNESFLVLVPRRFIGYRLKDAVGADAQTAFHEEALEHQAAQERFAAASVLADANDLVALRSWLGLNGSRPEQAARRNAVAYATLPGGLDGPTLIGRIASGDIIPSGAGSVHIQRRAEQLQQWLDGGVAAEISGAIDFIFDPTLSLSEEDPEKRRWLGADLATLREAAHEIAATLEQPTLQAVLATLRYRIATRVPLLPESDEPRVRIMTLHAAKGLEGDNIIVAGVADQLIPGLTDDVDEIAEQRRLLYVAITRARESLVVSWPRAVSYADAAANGIRMSEGVFTRSGQRLVRCSRTTLLPQALPGGIAGDTWLESHQS